MGLPDDLSLELGLIAGRQRSTRGHECDTESVGALIRISCPHCQKEIATAIIGCASCIALVSAEYAAHQFIEHRYLLEHAQARFSAGLGHQK